MHHRQQHPARDRVDSEARQGVVEDRVRIRLVEALKRSAQARCMIRSLVGATLAATEAGSGGPVSRDASAADTPESISAFIALTRSSSPGP